MTSLSKIIPLALLALSLSAAAASADHPRPHDPPRWQADRFEAGWRVLGVSRHDRLNVRAGPGVRYPVLRQLRPRARGLEKIVCVPTFHRRQFDRMPYRMRQRLRAMPTWCLIGRNGRRVGWVNARFLGR